MLPVRCFVHQPFEPVEVAADRLRRRPEARFAVVIDDGVDFSHPDLAGRKWTNPDEIPGNGIDDDNNGYVDDINGWDFANNDATLLSANLRDFEKVPGLRVEDWLSS